MTQDEETIRRIKVLEDSWEIKTNEVKRLLKMRHGDSFRDRISVLKKQIAEIEEKLFNFPRIPLKINITAEIERPHQTLEGQGENENT